MKYTTIFLLFFLPVLSGAQDVTPPADVAPNLYLVTIEPVYTDGRTTKPRISLPVEYAYTPTQAFVWGAGMGSSFLSGMCYGVREVVQHHPNRIPDHFNEQWWDTRLSWTNKYKNNDVAQGRTLTPVVFTDAYHAFSTGNRWFGLGAGMVIGIGIEQRRKQNIPVKTQIAQAAADLLFNAAMYQLGFLLVYKTDFIFDP